MRLRALGALVLLLAASPAVAAEERVEALLSRMTLEEKVAQLLQFTPDQKELTATIDAKAPAGSVLMTTGAQQANELQRRAIPASRQRIPLLVGYDVIHGYRTIFPIPLAIAATWDPEMAQLSARVAAREARAAGIHWTFAPMLDVARDPRWGRIAEGSGEDPLLTSVMGAGYVRGFQDAPKGEAALLACAKHFVGYGAAAGGRDYGDADVSTPTLREVYLPPFRAALDAGVATFMSAFNTIDGVPATANRMLLDRVLRSEWKFRGLVVSDWAAIAELLNHGVAATREDAALQAINAGIDLDMWDGTFATLVAAVREGRLAQRVVDDAVRRVLAAKVQAGVFERPIVDVRRVGNVTLTRENRDAARRVAQRSIVLLRNEGLLPLAKQGRKIVVTGPLASSRADMLGPWFAEGKADETVSVIDALRTRGIAFTPIATAGPLEIADDDIARATDAAREADVVIAVVGETRDMSGEAASRSTLDLPGRQQQLVNALVATGKPIVVVLVAGRPLAVPRIAETARALLHTWFLGTEAGNAIVDVLFGDVSPSGRLPITIPRSVGQVPIFYAQRPSGRPANQWNKYSNKYSDLPVTPLYPFGHGLTYTKFEYSPAKVSAASMRMDGTLTVSAEIRNSGSRGGEEVVQFYVRDLVASVSRPVRELKGFQRIALAPGQSATVTFTLRKADLAFWTPAGMITEPGEFTAWIAPDAASGTSVNFRVEPEGSAGSDVRPAD
jgi:beta-glucosidase